MIGTMVATIQQVAGVGGPARAVVWPAPLVRVTRVLRRTVGFAIVGGGMAVIVAHGLQRVLGG